MNILGIETSCDETASAVISFNCESKMGAKILSSSVYSQTEEHLEYGGVVPEIASRAHLEKVSNVVQKSLTEASLTLKDINGIAVTSGPGLLGGLLVGVNYAKSLSLSLNIPYIGVNHLEGHALTACLTERTEFPYLLLLVSGGHCQYIHVKALGSYEIIGETLDDSLGECFDKVAKMLGLPYPGGPQIEYLAKEGDANSYTFPIPLKDKGISFSFSGLKSAVRREILEKGNAIQEQDIKNICASFQQVVANTLLIKSNRALEQTQAKNFVLAGGVAANKLLRKSLEGMCVQNDVTFSTPPIPYCTDNAVMIAYTGGLRLLQGEKSDSSLKPTPRWPLKELSSF